MSWTIELYTDESGHSNVKEFLDNLEDTKLKAKVLRDIKLLGEKGIALKEPQVSHVDDGIWELRTKQSSNISRILYFIYTGQRFILLNGFVKKTQKTPPEEIMKAKKYRADFIRRNK